VSDPQKPPSPLFQALHAERYERQQLIRDYQDQYRCRLVVMIDAIFPESVTPFEELIYDADPKKDLHLMLASPGGDGEVAVRLVRAAQARCKRLTVIVPDEAKSAATLLAVGAHEIMMGPTSDLGPTDPQMRLGDGSLVAAKDIIAAVEDSAKKVEEAPDTYTVYSPLLAEVTAIQVQQARAALARMDKLLNLAIRANPDRTKAESAKLLKSLKKALITDADYHGELLGIEEAEEAGLRVVRADPSGDQWGTIWRLWTKYFVLGAVVHAYEAERASNVHGHPSWPTAPGPQSEQSPNASSSSASSPEPYRP
jgi:hypothetical protein